MNEQVVTNLAPQYPGLLSQAIIVNGFIFTSGIIHTTLDGKFFVTAAASP